MTDKQKRHLELDNELIRMQLLKDLAYDIGKSSSGIYNFLLKREITEAERFNLLMDYKIPVTKQEFELLEHRYLLRVKHNIVERSKKNETSIFVVSENAKSRLTESFLSFFNQFL